MSPVVVSRETDMLMRTCRERGIELRVEDGQVKWRAPSGAMSIALLREIKARQVELKRALSRPVRLLTDESIAVSITCTSLEQSGDANGA